jgi:hypothetical protein
MNTREQILERAVQQRMIDAERAYAIAEAHASGYDIGRSENRIGTLFLGAALGVAAHAFLPVIVARVAAFFS